MYWNPGRNKIYENVKKQVTREKPTLALYNTYSYWYILFLYCADHTQKKDKKNIHLRVSKSRENFSLAVGIMVNFALYSVSNDFLDRPMR